VVAVLAGVILFALNPTQRLEDANSAQTVSKSADIRKAIEAYVVANNGSMPTNIAALTTYGLHDICKQAQSTNCINLDQLVTDGYIGSIPEDKKGSTTVVSGYKLEYNPAKNNVQVYNTDNFTDYVEDGATLTTGLVGYWKMDEASWTNNCSTATVMDSSGNNRNGLSCLSGSGLIAGAAGRYDKAGDFDGVNDYISVPTSGITSQISMSGWFYIDTFATSWSSVFGNYKISPTANGIDFIPRSGSIMLCAGDGTPYVNATHCNASFSSAAVTTGTWIHGVFTYDGITLRAYINGALIGSVAKTLDNTNTIFTIGRWDSVHNNYYFDGRIDDVRAYNRALSAAEVSAIYNYAPPAVAHWKFDEGSGTTAADSSGNGNNGTLTNSPTWTSGLYSNAISFDGINDLVSVPNTVSLNPSLISMTAWVYNFACTPTTDTHVIRKESSYILSSCWQGNLQLYLKTNGDLSWKGLNGNTALPLNKWSHIAATYNGINARLYINGVQVNTTTSIIGNINTTTSTVDLNGDISNSNFGNYISDDIRIYNYELSPTQIQKIMNNEI
jgi:hypothetical protein